MSQFYRVTYPVWQERNLQVFRGVEHETDAPLLVYRFKNSSINPNIIENDLKYFEDCHNASIANGLMLLPVGLGTYDLLVPGQNGQRISNTTQKNPILILFCIYQAYDSLQKLFMQKRIGNRDVSLHNVMADQHTQVKIIDFGLSYSAFLGLKGQTTSIPLLVESYSIYWPVDVLYGYVRDTWEYSLGIMFLVLLLGPKVEIEMKEIVRSTLKPRVSLESVKNLVCAYIIDSCTRVVKQSHLAFILALLGFQRQIQWKQIGQYHLFQSSIECVKLMQQPLQRQQQQRFSRPSSRRTAKPPLPPPRTQQVSPMNQGTYSMKSEFIHIKRHLGHRTLHQTQSTVSTQDLIATQMRTMSQHQFPQALNLTLSQLINSRSKSTPQMNFFHSVNNPVRPKQPRAQASKIKTTFATATDTEAPSDVQLASDDQLKDKSKKKLNMRMRNKSIDDEQPESKMPTIVSECHSQLTPTADNNNDFKSTVGTASEEVKVQTLEFHITMQSTPIITPTEESVDQQPPPKPIQMVNASPETPKKETPRKGTPKMGTPRASSLNPQQQCESPNLSPIVEQRRNSLLESSSIQEFQDASPSKSILKKNNFIQLIQPQNHYADILKEYKMALDAYKVIGEGVVIALDFLKTSKNFWILPLFLVFKRMYQIRKEIEAKMKSRHNFLQHPNFEQFSVSKEYKDLTIKLMTENKLIYQDLTKLLQASIKKTQNFDKEKLKKIQWFLNDQLDQQLQDQCFMYIYSQLLPHIQLQLKLAKQKESSSPNWLDWHRLVLQMLATIIITESEPMLIPLDQFDYELFSQEYMNYTQPEQLEVVQEILETTVLNLKQRLIAKGFKL